MLQAHSLKLNSEQEDLLNICSKGDNHIILGPPGKMKTNPCGVVWSMGQHGYILTSNIGAATVV